MKKQCSWAQISNWYVIQEYASLRHRDLRAPQEGSPAGFLLSCWLLLASSLVNGHGQCQLPITRTQSSLLPPWKVAREGLGSFLNQMGLLVIDPAPWGWGHRQQGVERRLFPEGGIQAECLCTLVGEDERCSPGSRLRALGNS